MKICTNKKRVHLYFFVKNNILYAYIPYIHNIYKCTHTLREEEGVRMEYFDIEADCLCRRIE